MICAIGKQNLKQKNEIIKVNRNYSNAEKRKWANKYVHEHHAYDKNNAGQVNLGSFPQQIWCHYKLGKCVDKELCEMHKVS